MSPFPGGSPDGNTPHQLELGNEAPPHEARRRKRRENALNRHRMTHVALHCFNAL